MARHRLLPSLLLMLPILMLAPPGPQAEATPCAPDAVPVGDTCVDRYEASVWRIPDPQGDNKNLVKRIERGKVRLSDLIDGGAIQQGCPDAPFNAAPYGFGVDGNWTPLPGTDPPTPGFYAVSVAGVFPSTCISQLQAQQACRLAGKHLITNTEWQSAAAGTPDPGATDDGVKTCVTHSPDPAKTGARSDCSSSWGAHDMIGNITEWVADWADRSIDTCADWKTTGGATDGDESCFGGDAATELRRLPGAPTRGGAWGYEERAGILSIYAQDGPLSEASVIGFRCAR